ncbi:MAG: cystathionine gamma-synthase family protein [Alphaproteobacteria bacterium]|nr:cystathionine gamma-synthase family protein [Alphaproteobacteria bacterium]
MKTTRYHKRTIAGRPLHPETQMLSYGYDPMLSEGAIKPPIFLTSTFVFRSAEEGKILFDVIGNRRAAPEGQSGGLVYSRYNNPNLEMLEDRLALIDDAEDSLVFSSGMAAITTTLLGYLRPGDCVAFTKPLYGATASVIEKFLGEFGVTWVAIEDATSVGAIRASLEKVDPRTVKMILAETPANPSSLLCDIEALAQVAKEIGQKSGKKPILAVDNTLLGPVFQNPLKHGADMNIYSLTKYVAGHSDLVAGAVTGSDAALAPLRTLRGWFGCQLDPNSCWMVTRSLETVALRMNKAADNARAVAEFLKVHPKIEAVNFPSLLPKGDPQRAIFDKQCSGAGSTFSFVVKGGKDEAFRVLDSLQIVKLAVSLGGTESLACHPATTMHSSFSAADRARLGIPDGLIRISIGVEHPEDLVADLKQALG